MPTNVRSHATARIPFAPRLTPRDLALDADARAMWLDVLQDALMEKIASTGDQRLAYRVYRLRRRDDRSDPLELLSRIVVLLAGAGASESDVRRIPLFLNRVIDDCYVGNAHRNIDELDRAAQSLEYAENQLQLERRIDGHATPDELDAEATAIEAETALEIERARELRRRARMGRNGMGIAR